MTDSEIAGDEAQPTTLEDAPTGEFPIGAWTLIVCGAALAGGAFMFDVSVVTGQAALYGVPERVANIDRIAVRHMMLATGLAGFISGWIMLATHKIREEIRALAKPS